MSLRRLMCTAAFMGLIAVTLAVLTPAPAAMAEALRTAQRTADLAGPDALVIAAAGLLAWTVWAWGALGLTLTAASAVPGALGSAARLATHVVLPAGARRGAAVLLGLGLGVAGPLVVGTTVGAGPASAAPAAGVPDWPSARPQAAPPPPVPDWPGASQVTPEPGAHVVVRGDCLWRIAAAHLQAQTGAPPTDAQIAGAVRAWWTANAGVIGPDPDRLLPGQVLRPPGPA